MLSLSRSANRKRTPQATQTISPKRRIAQLVKEPKALGGEPMGGLYRWWVLYNSRRRPLRSAKVLKDAHLKGVGQPQWGQIPSPLRAYAPTATGCRNASPASLVRSGVLCSIQMTRLGTAL